jgi:hypothetical protein
VEVKQFIAECDRRSAVGLGVPLGPRGPSGSTSRAAMPGCADISSGSAT